MRRGSLPPGDASLLDFLKSESIRGFYTSRVGLKELDKGNSFYVKSSGCNLCLDANGARKAEIETFHRRRLVSIDTKAN